MWAFPHSLTSRSLAFSAFHKWLERMMNLKKKVGRERRKKKSRTHRKWDIYVKQQFHWHVYVEQIPWWGHPPKRYTPQNKVILETRKKNPPAHTKYECAVIGQIYNGRIILFSWGEAMNKSINATSLSGKSYVILTLFRYVLPLVSATQKPIVP